MRIEPATAADADKLAALWAACGLTRPWNDPIKDFHFALSCPASTVLVGREAGKIIASVMAGYDGHRGALYYVSVAPEHQGKGYGRSIHDAAIAWLKEQGVWKLNILVRGDNIRMRSFYEALGYKENEATSFAKAIE